MKEIWKDLKNFPDYMISNMGRIKSFKFNRITIRKLGRGGKMGYLHCPCVRSDGKSIPVYVHRAVVDHFIDDTPRPKGCGLEVDHIDGNVLNNKVDNLRIVTCSENLLNRKNVTSKYPGVHWNKRNKMWRVMKTFDKVQYFVGYFKDEKEAANKYEDTTLEELLALGRKGFDQRKVS